MLNTPELGQNRIKQITCNRDRILFAILTDDSLSIWFCKPCVPIVFHRRAPESIQKFGTNLLVEWKPDSSMIVIATSEGHLLFYDLGVIADQKGLYFQTDSPHANLRRDSAELFIKEIIPPLHLTLSQEVMVWDGNITSMVCITMTELMVATSRGHVLRYRWDGTQNRDYCLDLRRTPFCINQQVSKAIPIVEENTYIIDIEYSPLVGGFAITLNDGRAAFLTALSLRFDPNQVQGIWAQGIEDATCASVNHKYRLVTFGRANAECIVYCIDESTGGLETSHACVLSSKDYPGCPGEVTEVCWTPDGCAMAASWSKGGLGLWSTFGTLLMCTLGWDYGLHVDLTRFNPLVVTSMEWSNEGYQLWMVREQLYSGNDNDENSAKSSVNTVIQLDFVKSALTVNPCMSHQSHLYLQGDDKLYINLGDTLLKTYIERPEKDDGVFGDNSPLTVMSTLAEGRQWVVVPIPAAYSGTNWPVRYSAIDCDGQHIAVAGRTGLAHYSMSARKWKLFGNETQEKDFIITGGLLWWKDYLIMGSYSIVDNGDEIRLYPRECKLDNKFAKIIRVQSQVLLINNLQDQLVTFCSDSQVAIYKMRQIDGVGNVELTKLQAVDISALCVHPACVTSVTLTSLRTEPGRGRDCNSESMVLNVSGRLLMVQREKSPPELATGAGLYTCTMPTVLASCVENVWVPGQRKPDKVHLTEALWLFCGSHGMRVWLPLFPRDGDKAHTFMSKRIMLPFHLKIYPLAILFEDAIILGAENDTVLYTSDSNSPFSLPFSVLERTSQVYLHQILRQLIRRNLGFHAWEIARSCMSLPYFPHSLELLLHEVLEEEATSKEPIPDAQLPSIIEFIAEFPMYLQTVVQCARKTEIALWPYLFSVAGKPKDLFQDCMSSKQLDTAASYLIILQNLETSSVSRQYATLLLDTALDQCKWDLAKDLVRFLRAIDPNDVESPRTSFVMPPKFCMPQQTPPVSPNEEDLSVILGSVQVTRHRSYSTTVTPKIQNEHLQLAQQKTIANNVESPVVLRKKSMPSPRTDSRDNLGSAEEFFIDVILQRHARKLLSTQRLTDLGYFAAYLDFHLVTWLARERDRAARIDDFVSALKYLHEDFSWPYPTIQIIPRKNSSSTSIRSPPESPNIEDRLKSLRSDTLGAHGSQVGDSGYLSFPGGLPCTGLVTPVMSDAGYTSSLLAGSDSDATQILEAHLAPHGGLHDGASVASIASSTWGDDRDHMATSPDTDSWNDVPSTLALEQLSHQIATKGPPRSEVQLRYLLQLFMEASCLEWSLLISILLRDAMAVLRTINAAKSPDQSAEAVARLKQGLHLLNYWIGTECLGYMPFIATIHNQISVLGNILASKLQQQQQQMERQQQTVSSPPIATPLPARSRKTSSNHDATSHSSSHRDRLSSVSSITPPADRKTIKTDANSATVENNLNAKAKELLKKTQREIAVAEAVSENTGCVIS